MRTILVHSGTIRHQDQIIFIASPRRTRNDILHELNWWLFDYFYAQGTPFIRIPPLDDWTRSSEHHNHWFVHFPDTDWLLTIMEDPLTI